MRARAAHLLLAAPVLALAGEGRIPPAGPFCTGEYGDVLTALRPEVRAFEASPKASYVYLIRATATYDHLSYGRDGKVHHRYMRHVRHGTAFAYRASEGQWLAITNEHVARHPEVTEDDGAVEGVPAGSRKVRETIRIVKSESSEDEREQIPLTLVTADEALDVAILASRTPLQIMPYPIGHSSALQVGNAVLVRGYPLGVFAASNTGKVIGVAQQDREHDWNHEDFAVDALLNSGNSGSPVFAVSCRTGELELVGIYHAGYRDAQALNVVVAVDQIRDLLENPWAPRRRPLADESVPDRAVLRAVLASSGPVVMPFGDRAAEARADGDAVQFSVFESDWPLGARVRVSIRTGGASPSSVTAPRLGRGSSFTILHPELREVAARLEDALWRQLQAILRYRAAQSLVRPNASDALAVASRIRGQAANQREALQAFDFVSEAGTMPGATSITLETPAHPEVVAPPTLPASRGSQGSSSFPSGTRAGSVW